MADDSQTFKINIVSEAHNEGFVSASGAARKLANDTSELNDNTKRTTGLLPPLEENLKKGGEAADKAGISSHELGHALRDIGNIAAPGAGRALSELRFGLFGVGLAGFSAFEMVQKKIEEVEKALDDLESSNLSEHEQAIADLRQAWSDAKDELVKYDEAVKTAGQAKDPAGDRLKRIQEIAAAETQNSIHRIEELGKEEVAWLKAHGGSAEQIARAEEATRRSADSIRDAAAKKGIGDIQADIDARKERQSDFGDAQKGATFLVQQATDALKAAERAKADATPKPGEEQARNKRIQELEADIENQKLVVKNEPNDVVRNDAQKDLDEMQKEHDALVAEQKRQPAALDAANKAIDKATADKIHAESALKKAESAGEENQSRITQEKNEVATKQAVQTEKEKGEAAVNAAKDQETAINAIAGKDPKEIIAKGAAALDEINDAAKNGFTAAKLKSDYEKAIADKSTPGAFTDFDATAIARYQRFLQDQDALNQFRDLLVSMGGWGDSLTGIVKYHQAKFTTLDSEVKALQTALAQYQAQTHTFATQQ